MNSYPILSYILNISIIYIIATLYFFIIKFIFVSPLNKWINSSSTSENNKQLLIKQLKTDKNTNFKILFFGIIIGTIFVFYFNPYPITNYITSNSSNNNDLLNPITNI